MLIVGHPLHFAKKTNLGLLFQIFGWKKPSIRKASAEKDDRVIGHHKLICKKCDHELDFSSVQAMLKSDEVATKDLFSHAACPDRHASEHLSSLKRTSSSHFWSSLKLGYRFGSSESHTSEN